MMSDVAAAKGQDLAAKVDAIVEGVHFLRGDPPETSLRRRSGSIFPILPQGRKARHYLCRCRWRRGAARIGSPLRTGLQTR